MDGVHALILAHVQTFFLPLFHLPAARDLQWRSSWFCELLRGCFLGRLCSFRRAKRRHDEIVVTQIHLVKHSFAAHVQFLQDLILLWAFLHCLHAQFPLTSFYHLSFTLAKRRAHFVRCLLHTVFDTRVS